MATKYTYPAPKVKIAYITKKNISDSTLEFALVWTDNTLTDSSKVLDYVSGIEVEFHYFTTKTVNGKTVICEATQYHETVTYGKMNIRSKGHLTRYITQALKTDALNADNYYGMQMSAIVKPSSDTAFKEEYSFKYIGGTSDTGKYVSTDYFAKVASLTPAVPTVGEMEWNDRKDTVTVTATTDEDSPQTEYIQFMFAKDKDSIEISTSTKNCPTKLSLKNGGFITDLYTLWGVGTRRAQASFAASEFNENSKYFLGARAWNQSRQVHSEWTFNDTSSATMPNNKGLSIYEISASANHDDSIWFKWVDTNRPDSATSWYTIQYVSETPAFFESAPDLVTTISDVAWNYAGGKDSNGNKISRLFINGFETGKRYFFRICSTNSVGSSEYVPAANTSTKNDIWNSYSIILGEAPAAPTTWSQRTDYDYNDDICLYWNHNSKDGSKERYGRVVLTINDVVQKEFAVAKGTHYADPNDEAGDDPTEEDDSTSYYVYKLPTTMTDATIKWKVRTRGIYRPWANGVTVTPEQLNEAYSPYSVERTINVWSPPQISVRLWQTADLKIDKVPLDSEIRLNPGTEPYLNTYSSYWAFKGLDTGDTAYSFPFYLELSFSSGRQTPTGYSIVAKATDRYERVNELGNTEVINKDDVVYERNIDTTYSYVILPINAEDGKWSQGQKYKFAVSCTSNAGLSASNSFEVSTDQGYYMLDFDVSDVSVSDVGYTLTILPEAYNVKTIENTDGTNKWTTYERQTTLASYVSLFLYRKNIDGSYTKVGNSHINTDRIAFTDYHPLLTKYIQYRVVGRDNTTGKYYSKDFYFTGQDATFYPNVTGLVIQWDGSFIEYISDEVSVGVVNPDTVAVKTKTNALHLPYNVTISESVNKDVAAINYIGREDPVTYYGTAITKSFTYSASVPAYDEETLFHLRRLSKYMGNCYIRDSKGHGFWATVNVSFNRQYDSLVIPVSMNVTQVEAGATDIEGV